MFESYPNRRGQSLCVIRVGCAQRPVPHGRAVPPLGCWRADRPAYGRHGSAALAPSLRPEDARASGGFKFERLLEPELSFGPARHPSHRDGHAAVTVAGVTAAPLRSESHHRHGDHDSSRPASECQT